MDQNKPNADDQLVKLQQKIATSALPQDLSELLQDRIRRLTLLRGSSGFMSPSYILEFEASSLYIHWVTNLPWNMETKDNLDITTAQQILDKNHFGLPAVKNKVLEYLSALILNIAQNPDKKTMRAPILCLVGLAGSGKTTLAKSMAQALGRRFVRIPFGGMGDARSLRGQSRAYPDAEPGLIIKKIVESQAHNCVILLDELDRVSAEARSDIMGVLVELLDPEQNRAFTDHYVDYPFDLSRVLFVATANNTTNISTAVLDRLELVQMPSYSDEEKVTIAKSYLFPRVRDDTGLKVEQIQVDDTLWPTVIRPLGFDSGIRSLERTIQDMCRKVARQIVEKKAVTVHITEQNIREFLTT